jgi:hypothetical protein
MKFFTKSNLISIATLALVCFPSVAVSAANFKPSHTSEYSTLEMVNPETARSSNETDVAQRVRSNYVGDAQDTLGQPEMISNWCIPEIWEIYGFC